MRGNGEIDSFRQSIVVTQSSGTCDMSESIKENHRIGSLIPIQLICGMSH